MIDSLDLDIHKLIKRKSNRGNCIRGALTGDINRAWPSKPCYLLIIKINYFGLVANLYCI